MLDQLAEEDKRLASLAFGGWISREDESGTAEASQQISLQLDCGVGAHLFPIGLSERGAASVRGSACVWANHYSLTTNK